MEIEFRFRHFHSRGLKMEHKLILKKVSGKARFEFVSF